MDSKTVLSKTAKGLREASGASSRLPRALRGVLKEIDGKRTLSDLQLVLPKYAEAELKESLERLEKEGYVRDTGQLIQDWGAKLDSSTAMRSDEALGDLDFTALNVSSAKAPDAEQAEEAKARRSAEAKAKREAEHQAKLALKKAKQEAEEKARREAADKARKEAEARLEADARAKREAEERARREAEEKARREAEERARREAEEKARREAEEKARREAEEIVRKEAEEKARLEAEAQAKREAVLRAQREAEERARREADEKARREAEERARREAEEKARREAEERARREAEEKAQREAEEKARREAEQRALAEAEERARQAAKEKERLEAWESSKRKAEEKLKHEAEEKARLEAEDRIRIEAKERAACEAEAWLKETLKERARREAEEKARQEKEARLKKEAEEELRRETKAAARREAHESTARKAAESAAMAAERKATRPRVRWGKLTVLAALPLVAIVLVAIHFIPFSSRIPALEDAAARQFQQPVKIGGLRFSLFPRPHWRLDGVTIGNDSQIAIPGADAVIDLGGLFAEGMTYESIVLTSPAIKAEAAQWLLFGKAREGPVRVQRVRATDAVLVSPDIDLPRFDAKVDIGADSNWRKMVLEFSGRETYAELEPRGERVHFDLSASNFLPPFGGSLRFADFSAKGSFGPREMAITEFEVRDFGGSVSGDARLEWSSGWRLDGTARAKLDTRKLAPALFRSGLLEGKATYSARAGDGRSLFAAPYIEGSFAVGQGELLGVDLMHLLQGGGDSGKTGFREAKGAFVHERGVTQFKQLRIDAGILAAGGTAEVDASGAIRGRFATSYQFDNQRRSGSMSLSGTLDAPRFGR